MEYYRGLQYEREKAKHGGDRKSKGKDYPLKSTAQQLAEQHKVAEKTIKNNAQFARAIDNIAKAAGNSAKADLLSRDTKLEGKTLLNWGRSLRLKWRYSRRLSS